MRERYGGVFKRKAGTGDRISMRAPIPVGIAALFSNWRDRRGRRRRRGSGEMREKRESNKLDKLGRGGAGMLLYGEGNRELAVMRLSISGL